MNDGYDRFFLPVLVALVMQEVFQSCNAQGKTNDKQLECRAEMGLLFPAHISDLSAPPDTHCYLHRREHRAASAGVFQVSSAGSAIRGREDVVAYEPRPRGLGNLHHARDVDEVEVRVRRALQEEHLGLAADRGSLCVEVRAVDEGRGDAEA